MAHIMPTGDQFRQLMELNHNGPVVMVNLLRFKPDGGAESYAKYGKMAGDYVKKLGGRVLCGGKQLMALIGDEEWDEILLVEYPSVDSFKRMQKDKEYHAMVPYRTEGLIDSRLYIIEPG